MQHASINYITMYIVGIAIIIMPFNITLLYSPTVWPGLGFTHEHNVLWIETVIFFATVVFCHITSCNCNTLIKQSVYM